jgi:NADH:ubiquinone reductase (H+-translocating)
MSAASVNTLNIPSTGRPRVIIIGGGFGGINAAMKLRNKGFQIVLFDKHNYHTFQPMLYQVATAGLQPDAIAGPLRSIFKNHVDFHFRLFHVNAIDPVNKTISTEAGELAYDYLIIAGGSRPNFYGNKQVEENALPLKSIPDALNVRSQVMQVLEKAEMVSDPAELHCLLNFVLVGGGPTGVEMAGAIAELRKKVLPKDYPAIDFNQMQIWVIEGSTRLLAAMSEKASARAKKELEKMGVEVRVNTRVNGYDGRTLQFLNHPPIDASTVIWTAGVTSVAFPGLLPEALAGARILTDSFCRSILYPEIFAIGDIAWMKTEKYPKGHPGVAQVAIQMGDYVGKHLADFQAGRPVKAFSYFDKGTLATIGRNKAVLDIPGGWFIGGRIAWWIWLTIHINYLVSFRNKLLVFASWIWNYFTYDKGNRLIIRPYMKKSPIREKALTKG